MEDWRGLGETNILRFSSLLKLEFFASGIPPPAKAEFDSARFTARLEAAPFQRMSRPRREPIKARAYRSMSRSRDEPIKA
jgi:hypothetical protein